MSDSAHQLTVIYDGECDFCKECVKWVARKCTITAIPFQSADLARYGVTYEQCSKEVVAICNKKVFGGASAVAQLLHTSGYKSLAFLLRLSGPLGRAGYRWVATHRDGRLVHYATSLLRQINRTN
jgi:predicted DCC family thiol-disulfide oxidoreductase YuxK